MVGQLALSLTINHHCSFNNFLVHQANQELIFNLKNLIHLDNNPIDQIYLWGKPSTGKSHLLQATSQLSEQAQQRSCYLSAADLIKLPNELLYEFTDFSLVCLDDLQLIIGQLTAEKQLFAWYNWCKDKQVSLLIAGQQSVNQLSFALADLQSRLSIGASYRLTELTDQQKFQALQLHAKQRGLNLSLEVGNFLLTHYSRQLTKLLYILDILDKASLNQQRKLTIPFIKQTLVDY